MKKRLDLDALTQAGFYYSGCWRKHVSLLEDGAPRTPGVYALVQDDIVMFIGKSERKLSSRLRVHRHKAEADTARDVNAWLRTAVAGNGRVDVYVLECQNDVAEWNGLPVDVLAGVEAALIRELDPLYNRPRVYQTDRADRTPELAA